MLVRPAMTNIDPDDLRCVAGGVQHPATDPMGAARPPNTPMKQFKDNFERTRDNPPPPTRRWQFLPDPQNWGRR
jgi:hypothetical protein